MKIDNSGIKALLAILEWLWCVMADQVNYPEYPTQECDDCLWPEWDWAMREAMYSDSRAPWNQSYYARLAEELFAR